MHLHTYLPPITDVSEQLIDLFQPPMLQVAFTRMRKVLKITLNRQWEQNSFTILFQQFYIWWYQHNSIMHQQPPTGQLSYVDNFVVSSPQHLWFPELFIQALYGCMSQPFDADCCHMGTAIKHPVPDRVKPSLVIFDIRALWRSALSVRVPGCQKLQLNLAWHSCTHTATVSVKGLEHFTGKHLR